MNKRMRDISKAIKILSEAAQQSIESMQKARPPKFATGGIIVGTPCKDIDMPFICEGIDLSNTIDLYFKSGIVNISTNVDRLSNKFENMLGKVMEVEV